MTPEPAPTVFTARFTTEELLALVQGLGLPLPWLLRRGPIADLAATVRSDIERIGMRSLVAREIIANVNQRFMTPAPVEHLVRVICEPLLSIGVVKVEKGVATSWTYLARPEWSVSHAMIPMGIHAVTLFPTTDLLSVVVATSGLRETEERAGDEVMIPAEVIAQIANADGDVSSLSEHPGLDENTVSLLTQLSSETWLSSIVTVLRPTSAHAVTGSMTAWIDKLDEGLWMAESVSVDTGSEGDPASGSVRLTPTDSATILQSIQAGLPPSGTTLGGSLETPAQ